MDSLCQYLISICKRCAMTSRTYSNVCVVLSTIHVGFKSPTRGEITEVTAQIPILRAIPAKLAIRICKS